MSLKSLTALFIFTASVLPLHSQLIVQKDPTTIIKGHYSCPKRPEGIAFSPCGEVLAVCSRSGGRGITFYRQIKDKKGKYHPTPFYELTEQKLLEYGLSAAHGIAFSPDGKSLGVVHKRYFKTKEAMGESA